MASPDDQSFVSWLIAGASLAVTGVISWLWKHTMGRIDDLEKGKMDKDDFSTFVQRFDQHCRDDREVQAKLFDKLDGIKDILLERK